MFLRYQSKEMNEDSNSANGVFVEIWRLRDLNFLEKHEEQEAVPCMKWLGMHLKVPPILGKEENKRALSWFKDIADEPLKRIRTIVSILNEHDIHMELIKSNDPGIIIYEDGWQVVAKPYKKGKEYNK